MTVAEGKGSSRKLLWLIVVVLIILSVGTGATAVYLALYAKPIRPTSAQQATNPEPVNPIFVEIEPFTVNTKTTEGRSRLLYLGMTFQLGNEKSKEVIETYMPQVRSRLLMQLSDEKVDELNSAQGKSALAERLQAVLLDPPLAEHLPKLALDQILFTEFIVQ